MSYSGLNNSFATMFRTLQELGWIGVDLFFVLSGFLISGLLYREVDETGGLKVKRFLLRRGFKIWPSYYVAYGGMTLLVVLRAVLQGDWEKTNFTLRNAFWNVIFVQNYVDCERWSHSWSIAVEEHFYLFLPLVFLGVIHYFRKKSVSLQGVFWFCLFIIFLVPALRTITLVSSSNPDWNWNTTYYNWHPLYYRSHLRMDSLCFGVLIGYLFRYQPETAKKIASKLWLGIPLVAFSFAIPLIWPAHDHWFCGILGFSLIALGFSWLVLAAGVFPETGEKGNPLFSIPCKVLAWIGIYSYTIYLAHSVAFGIPGADWSRRKLIQTVSQWFPDTAVMGIDILYFWFLSIVGGVLLSHLIERPLLKIRKRYVPAHSASELQIDKEKD